MSIVEFYDMSFEDAVRSELRKSRRDIYWSDFPKIRELWLTDILAFEEDLPLLEKFTNLEKLHIRLTIQQTSYLKNLKHLTLLELDIEDRGVFDLSLFENLKNLKYLFLRDLCSLTKYINFPALGGLNNLKELLLEGFEEVDLTGITEMKSIEYFGLKYADKIYGLNELVKFPNLKNLELRDVWVKNLDFLKPLNREIFLELASLLVKEKLPDHEDPYSHVDYNLINSFPNHDFTEIDLDSRIPGH